MFLGKFPASGDSRNHVMQRGGHRGRIVPVDNSVLFFTHIFYLLLTLFLYKLVTTVFCFLALLVSLFF